VDLRVNSAEFGMYCHHQQQQQQQQQQERSAASAPSRMYAGTKPLYKPITPSA
jgi:hypothetical protein